MAEQPSRADAGRVEKWRKRDLDARYHNEPLYVSPEEMQELRQLEVACQRDEMVRHFTPGPRTTYAALGGTPVVVDPERADEQRARVNRLMDDTRGSDAPA